MHTKAPLIVCSHYAQQLRKILIENEQERCAGAPRDEVDILWESDNDNCLLLMENFNIYFLTVLSHK